MSKEGVSYFFQYLTSFEAEKLSELGSSADVLLAWNATVMSNSIPPNHGESRARAITTPLLMIREVGSETSENIVNEGMRARQSLKKPMSHNDH